MDMEGYNFHSFANETFIQDDLIFYEVHTLNGSFESWFFVVLCTLLLLVCVIGNALVIAGFATCPVLRVLTNYWIIRLFVRLVKSNEDNYSLKVSIQIYLNPSIDQRGFYL